MKPPPERMLTCAHWRDPRHVVEQFVRIRDTPLRIIARGPECGKPSRDGDRRKTGIEHVLFAIHYAREGIPVRVLEDGGSVEAGIGHRQKCLVPGKAEAKLVQKSRGKRVRLRDYTRPAHRLVTGSA